jgi:serine/threonine-protein kinase
MGLCAVHDAGIVHRDVKPDNVFLLGPADAPSGVRLFDFGLAKLHTEESSESGDILGTAAYMAPEQVLCEAVDARSDVYSLGVVLFRAITGHLPFEGPNDLEMVAQHVLLPSPPPSWFVEGLDPRIDAVVLRAIRKRPENRYPSMHVFAEDLGMLPIGLDAPLSSAGQLVEPDAYDPVTENGAQALEMFRRTLGMPASGR